MSDAAISQDVPGAVASRKRSGPRVGVTPGDLPAVIAVGNLWKTRGPRLINARVLRASSRVTTETGCSLPILVPRLIGVGR